MFSRPAVSVKALPTISAELPRAEWTDAVSQSIGRIKGTLERRGTRIEDVDAAIAAHALALDATLVTANVNHMIRVRGLLVEDWS
jgi:tRNA(fMet)-specific endonuclease VapC